MCILNERESLCVRLCGPLFAELWYRNTNGGSQEHPLVPAGPWWVLRCAVEDSAKIFFAWRHQRGGRNRLWSVVRCMRSTTREFEEIGKFVRIYRSAMHAVCEQNDRKVHTNTNVGSQFATVPCRGQAGD